MTAKEHYTGQFHPQFSSSMINKETYKYIKKLNIKTSFEFGCNIGRHLLVFRKMGIDAFGMDINATNVFYARFLNHLDTVEIGDELSLHDIPDDSFDLIFTNSVMCHIEHVQDIFREFVRITKRHIIMVEAVERQGKHWWEHSYLGKEVFKLQSEQKKIYKCFHYDKTSQNKK